MRDGDVQDFREEISTKWSPPRVKPGVNFLPLRGGIPTDSISPASSGAVLKRRDKEPVFLNTGARQKA